MQQVMYNSLSSDYDRFVNWQNRLSIELPFIIEHLQKLNARSVLDAATGTGMHAIALAQLGYATSAADISHGMIQKAPPECRFSRSRCSIRGYWLWLPGPNIRLSILRCASLPGKFTSSSLNSTGT